MRRGDVGDTASSLHASIRASYGFSPGWIVMPERSSNLFLASVDSSAGAILKCRPKCIDRYPSTYFQVLLSTWVRAVFSRAGFIHDAHQKLLVQGYRTGLDQYHHIRTHFTSSVCSSCLPLTLFASFNKGPLTCSAASICVRRLLSERGSEVRQETDSDMRTFLPARCSLLLGRCTAGALRQLLALPDRAFR